MTYCLPPQAVVRINTRVIGGAGSLRDQGLREPALGQPLQSFGGEDLYPGVFDRAAALALGIARNHAFTDGNKRTAWTSATTYLGLLDIELRRMPDDEAGQCTLDLAEGVIGWKSAALWLTERVLE